MSWAQGGSGDRRPGTGSSAASLGQSLPRPPPSLWKTGDGTAGLVAPEVSPGQPQSHGGGLWSQAWGQRWVMQLPGAWFGHL